MINQLLLGILSSIVGSAIIVVITGLISKKAKWILVGILSRIVDSDLDFVFLNKKGAEEDLKYEINRAKKVLILAGRGNELNRSTFSKLFSEDPNGLEKDVRILLPAIKNLGDEKDWTDQREKEVAIFDISYQNEGILKKQIETNIDFVNHHKNKGILNWGLFNIPHIGRIIITDKVAYYTPYEATAHGRDSKVFDLCHQNH